VVGALVVVNAFGDVVDPKVGKVLAGARSPHTGGFVNTASALREDGMKSGQASHATTVGVVAANIGLGKGGAVKVAQMAQDGLARVVSPVHTMYDGDTMFAVAPAGAPTPAEVTRVGSMAAEAVGLAVMDAVRQAKGAGGVPAASTLGTVA